MYRRQIELYKLHSGFQLYLQIRITMRSEITYSLIFKVKDKAINVLQTF